MHCTFRVVLASPLSTSPRTQSFSATSSIFVARASRYFLACVLPRVLRHMFTFGTYLKWLQYLLQPHRVGFYHVSQRSRRPMRLTRGCFLFSLINSVRLNQPLVFVRALWSPTNALTAFTLALSHFAHTKSILGRYPGT